MDGICIFRYAIFVISFLIICFSLIPLSKNSAWYIRIFDYPRSQKFWINLILLVSLITIIRFERNEIILLCLLTANVTLVRRIKTPVNLQFCKKAEKIFGGCVV